MYRLAGLLRAHWINFASNLLTLFVNDGGMNNNVSVCICIDKNDIHIGYCYKIYSPIFDIKMLS